VFLVTFYIQYKEDKSPSLLRCTVPWAANLESSIGSGGESFFIVDSSQEEQSSLSSYVDLVDSFREIHRRTWPNSPALVSTTLAAEA
jgi:hypothetical protein